MKKIVSVLSLIFASGCASVSNYHPVVDAYSDQRAPYLQQDYAQCEQIAKQNAGVGKGIATDGITGALIGGAGGAAIGAIFGSPQVGAAAGGAIGGLGGAAKGGFEANDTYKRIFRNCLRARGHQVLD